MPVGASEFLAAIDPMNVDDLSGIALKSPRGLLEFGSLLLLTIYHAEMLAVRAGRFKCPASMEH